MENSSAKKYPFWKWILCYLLAGVLTVIIMKGIGDPVASILNNQLGYSEETGLDWVDLFKWLGIVWVFVSFTRYFGDKWRAREEDIKAGVTDFTNIFYDPNFQRGPFALQQQYRNLSIKYERAQDLLLKSQKNAKNLQGTVESFGESLKVFIRHHENANRLLSSSAFLLHEDSEKFSDEMLSNILAECMTILKHDNNDKSIALYQVRDNQLVMRKYSRVSAESSRKRTFAKGEGFAGEVWATMQDKIVSVVDPESDERFQGELRPRHDFKSIMGVPIRIGDEVLGVLCLQSETENGFSDEDLRAVKFYANCCSLIFLYDKLKP